MFSTHFKCKILFKYLRLKLCYSISQRQFGSSTIIYRDIRKLILIFSLFQFLGKKTKEIFSEISVSERSFSSHYFSLSNFSKQSINFVLFWVKNQFI
jgi:hypothetical protein